MTIYNVKNTFERGRPCRVFDANGEEYHKGMECDTETGRIVQQVGKDGQPVITNDDRLVFETVMAPAPLQIVFVTPQGGKCVDCHRFSVVGVMCSTCGAYQPGAFSHVKGKDSQEVTGLFKEKVTDAEG